MASMGYRLDQRAFQLRAATAGLKLTYVGRRSAIIKFMQQLARNLVIVCAPSALAAAAAAAAPAA